MFNNIVTVVAKRASVTSPSDELDVTESLPLG